MNIFHKESSEGPAAKIVAKKRAAQKQQHKREQPQAGSTGKTRLPGATASSKGDASSLHANEPFKALDDNYYSHSDRFILSSSVPVPGLGPSAGGSGGYGDPGTDALLRDTGADVLRAGGYRLSEAQERAIRTSIAGLSLGLVIKD
jgi:CDK-activating kinase assembly factor MAT1